MAQFPRLVSIGATQFTWSRKRKSLGRGIFLDPSKSLGEIRSSETSLGACWPMLPSKHKRRESRRGTHECVRHVSPAFRPWRQAGFLTDFLWFADHERKPAG